jgi:hypothetical protein
MKKLVGTMLTRLIWLSIVTDGLCMGMNLWFPYMGNFWTSYRPISFSRTLLCGYCVECGREVKGATYDPNHSIITCQVDAGLKPGTPRYATVVMAHNAVAATTTTSVQVLICNRGAVKLQL